MPAEKFGEIRKKCPIGLDKTRSTGYNTHMKNKRHIADKEFKRAASVCPNVFKVSVDKPCRKCGKVMMIPEKSGICIPCVWNKP